MRNLLKKNNGLFLLCSLSLLMMLFVSCQDVKLKAAIQIANKQCPMDMGEVGMITSIVYDGSNVVYTFNVNEENVNIKALRENPESMKESIMVMYQHPTQEVKTMLELVVKCNAGLQMIFVGKDSGNKATCELTTDEIKKALNAEVGTSENNLARLEAQVKMANLQFPMQAGDEIVIEKLEIDDKSITYICRVDEDLCGIDQLESSYDAVKEGIVKSLASQTDAPTQLFIQTCVDCGRSIVYRYIGDESESQFDVEVTVDELKGMLIKK